MNIQELRETKIKLEHMVNYCPSDGASIAAFDRAEEAAFRADEQLRQIAPTFALLDVINELTARVERLERLTGHSQKKAKLIKLIYSHIEPPHHWQRAEGEHSDTVLHRLITLAEHDQGQYDGCYIEDDSGLMIWEISQGFIEEEVL